MDEFQAGWHYWRNVAINVVASFRWVSFSGVFLCGWKDQAGNSAHHCAGIPRQPHDRSAAGISSDPRLGVTDLITNTFGTASERLYASGVSSITGLPNPVFHLFIRWINIRL